MLAGTEYEKSVRANGPRSTALPVRGHLAPGEGTNSLVLPIHWYSAAGRCCRGEAVNEEECVAKSFAVCCIALWACFAANASAQDKQALGLVQTIPLPGVKGRLDHLGVDLQKKRLFVAAVTNNSLEIVDLADAKVIIALPD